LLLGLPLNIGELPDKEDSNTTDKEDGDTTDENLMNMICVSRKFTDTSKSK
jgi:hypothetical protein